MTIRHHPDEALLGAYAGGVLDLGRHVAVATHLFGCAPCAAMIAAVELVGGDALAAQAPAAMSAGALRRVIGRLDEEVPPASEAEPARSPALKDVPGLPAFVRRYPCGPWQSVALGVKRRRIALPTVGETRVFLLKSAPRSRLIEHRHTGHELTCVLAGGFSHEGGHYGPGDFDLGDPSVNHTVSVDAGVPCVSLVAMGGRLKFSGLFGALIDPFINL